MKIHIHDAETGETIERDMTEEEIAELEAAQAACPNKDADEPA